MDARALAFQQGQQGGGVCASAGQLEALRETFSMNLCGPPGIGLPVAEHWALYELLALAKLLSMYIIHGYGY